MTQSPELEKLRASGREVLEEARVRHPKSEERRSSAHSQVAARELGFRQLLERLEAMRLRRAKDPCHGPYLEHFMKCR